MPMQKNDLLTLAITEVNNLGAGVGRGEDGRVVFVRGAVTGDTVRARLIKVNRSYLVARLEEVLIPSPHRLAPEDEFCHAPESCGGCIYRHVGYEHELDMKRRYVEHAFIKAGLPEVTVEPVRSTGRMHGYRNKAQYPFGKTKNGVCIGFYATGSHTLIPCEACPMQPKLFADVAAHVCRFAERAGWSVYEETTGKGLLRHLYLRYGEGTDQLMVCLVLCGQHLPKAPAFVESLIAAFPETASVMLNINMKNTNVVLGPEYRTLYGTPYIEDVLCGKRLRIAPGAFYQVNHDGAELLYALAAERTGLTGQGTLLDLYCGIGSIGLSMAERAERLVGIEIVESAVVCARENAARNGVHHATFSCGDASDAEKLLDAAEAAYGPIEADTVILDPPRKGSTPELITYLCNTRKIPRIVYVSCDPDTLARDCALFRQLGYQIGTVTPVDMFPRTGHVETVCLLSKLHADQHIEVELNLDEMDLTTAESKATYDEIKEYVLENTGLKVSQLYIAQIKRKYGIIERANYNLPKSENSKVPNCPPDKEAAIVEALKHFGMIK